MLRGAGHRDDRLQAARRHDGHAVRVLVVPGNRERRVAVGRGPELRTDRQMSVGRRAAGVAFLPQGKLSAVSCQPIQQKHSERQGGRVAILVELRPKAWLKPQKTAKYRCFHFDSESLVWRIAKALHMQLISN